MKSKQHAAVAVDACRISPLTCRACKTHEERMQSEQQAAVAEGARQRRQQQDRLETEHQAALEALAREK